MAITPKTASDFISSFLQFVSDYNTANGTNVNTGQGTVFKDVMIDAPSQQFASLDSNIALVSQVASVNFATSVSTSDLDALGANYGKTRNLATNSTGEEYFIADTAPTASVTINQGTIISTPASGSTSQIQFQTTETVVMDVNNLPFYSFLDGLVTRYRILAPITALTSGSGSNVGAGSIITLGQAVPGITRVTNPVATTNGTDTESNTSFANRIQLSLTGNSVGTVAGIQSLMLSDSRVIDVSIARAGDPVLLRNEFGGSVDVYVLGNGSGLQATTETQIFSLSLGYVILATTPVDSVTSVTGTVSGSPFTFTLGTNAIFLKDPGLFTDSVRENSVVVFPTPTKPDNGSLITIGLNTNVLIRELQIEIDLPENSIVASDILIRAPKKVTINVYCKVGIFSGFAPLTVANNVKTAISTLVNGLKLGNDVIASDLIAAADHAAGVNGIDVPSFTPSTDTPITTGQVARAGTISVQIGAVIY